MSIHQLDRIAVKAPVDQGAHALLDAALTGPAQALPHVSLLERHFGQALGWVQVHSGPAVHEALTALGAVAATRGEHVFLRDRSAPVEVVAHEVTHALQVRTAGGATGPTLLPADAPQEREAASVAQTFGAPAGPWPVETVRPAAGLSTGSIALLRPPPARAEASTIVPVTPASAAIVSEPAEPRVIGLPTEPVAEPSPRRVDEGGSMDGSATAAPDAATRGEEFTLPPAPELTVSAEDVAAQEAAATEAEAEIAGAMSASDLIAAYAASPPSVKARQAASLSANLDAATTGETEQWQSAVPQIEAKLQGAQGPSPKALRVEAPAAGKVELEAGAVPPAPEPDVPDVPEPSPFTANDEVTSVFARFSEPPPEQLAQAIGDSLSDVQTTDPAVPRSPGPPPHIPLGGETDPERIANQQDAGREQIAHARESAGRAIVEGPGPEQVEPVTVEASYGIDPVEPPSPSTLTPPEGPEAFLAMPLPPEVQTVFDEQQGAAMRESMAQASAKAEETTTARDRARDEAVATAQDGAAELNRMADTEQRTVVTDARTTIQTERQSAIDAQHAEVERVRGETAEQRALAEGKIETRVGAEQQAIDDRYTRGEADIQHQVADGERRAREERVQAERKAQNQSWWDRAVNFVKAAFSALVAAIGKIFDAIRSVVNRVLDAVKDFALRVIDRVASFVKSAIAAFGELLKLAVSGLVGRFFPELAERLNKKIDSAVAAAQAAVDQVADKLKAGISALVEGLRAGINAAISAFEAGISLAVTFVAAALTGDWAMLARKVLESVLKVIGVSPETFYAFIGRAQETFEIIIADPLRFLSNVVDAVVGGVQRFAGRFTEHLKLGVLGWLTGALGSAGIVLPATFDLMGVLDLARQILGLTWEMIRRKAVKLIGEKNVERLEFIGQYVTTLVNEGWGGLWSKLVADLRGLFDIVFGGIKSFLLERVVFAVVKKIPMLFNPVGALVQLVLTAWNLYEFLRDRLSRIAAVVRTVVDSIGDIARGVLTGAVAKVEEVLGQLLPLALDLLARLLGLGDVSRDVRAVIEKVRAFIDKAIDALIARVVGAFKGRGEAGVVGPPGFDPNDHAAVAVAAIRDLEEGAATAEYAPLRTEREVKARAVEKKYTKLLKPGIALTVTFPAAETDALDDVLNFEVIVAPNATKKQGSVAAKRASIRLQGGKLIIGDTTFGVGDAIQLAKGESWHREQRVITGFAHETLDGAPFVMVSFDTDPPSARATVTAGTYPKQWRKPIESLRGLSDERLREENAKSAWGSFETAKKVLNFRVINVQHVNPKGKEWEHIAEESTGGSNSLENLALADSGVNRRLGQYYGTVRTYPMLALEDITEPIRLREYMRGKNEGFQRRYKIDNVYPLDEFRVSLRWMTAPEGRGKYQELK